MKLSAGKWLAYLMAMTSWKTPTPTQDLATQPSATRSLNPREEDAANPGGPFWPLGFPTTNIFITDDGPVELTEARLGTLTQTLTIDVTRNTIMRTTTVTGTDFIVSGFTPPATGTWVTALGTPKTTSIPSVPSSISVSALTVVSCTKDATCTPAPTTITYTCPQGSNGLVTTTMQQYSCTAGEICTAVPFKATFTCNCGSSVCATEVPYVAIPLLVLPMGGAIPPPVWPDIVQPSPPIPPEYEEPDVLTTTPPAEPLDETSTTTSHEASSTISSSETSTTSRSTSTSSSSSSILSTTTSTSRSSTSSSSTASACAYGPLSLPADIDKTISAWLAQFPFTLTTSDTTSTTTTSSTSSSSTRAPSTITSSKSTSTSKEATLSTITPALTTTAPFVAPYVPPFVPDADPAFSSSLSAESVSRAASVSSAAAAEATSICQHWGVKSFPKDIPLDWLPKTDQTDNGYLCVAEPDKMNIDKDIWGTDWELQPFSIDNGWEDTDPDQTLVDEFCDMLVDNSVDITYDGKVQGACAVYGRGACTREEHAECAMYEHEPVAANEATVVFAVTYKTNSPECGDEHNKSTNYVNMGRKKCKEKLNKNLINKCKFDKKPKQDSNVYKGFPVLGGTYWDGCMQYTIVAVKNPPKAGF